MSSTASVYSELNNVAYSTPTTGGSSVTLTFTVSPASGSPSTTFHLECSVSGGAPSSVEINVDSSPVAVCPSSPCSYDGSFPAGNHTATCTANVGGNTYTKNASFSVVDNPPSVSAVTTDVGGGSYELNCSATDDVQLSQISIYLDGGSTPEKTCSFSGVSGTCSKIVSVAAGSHELNCVAVDNTGHVSHASKTFTVGSTNHAPVASFTYSPSSPTTADEIEFNSTSTDPDGDSLSCFWKFGDGDTSTSCNSMHKYHTAGTYTVELNVVDPSGAYDVATQSITVSASSADTTPPSVALDGVPTAWQNTDATVSVVCNDSGSGCDSSSYRVFLSNAEISTCPSDYAQYTYTSPTTVSSHVWACGAAKDNAGNIGFSGVYEVNVDTNAPTITLLPSDKEVSQKSFTVTATCSDSDSGCAGTYMYYRNRLILWGDDCPDPGSGYSATATLDVEFSCTKVFWHEVCLPITVCAYATDNAGNTSSVVKKNYTYKS